MPKRKKLKRARVFKVNMFMTTKRFVNILWDGLFDYIILGKAF